MAAAATTTVEGAPRCIGNRLLNPRERAAMMKGTLKQFHADDTKGSVIEMRVRAAQDLRAGRRGV